MSWKSAAGELPEVGWGDGDLWSIGDAEWLLGIPAREIRGALRVGGREPVGRRLERGRGTRHVRVYRAEDVLEALGLKVF